MFNILPHHVIWTCIYYFLYLLLWIYTHMVELSLSTFRRTLGWHYIKAKNFIGSTFALTSFLSHKILKIHTSDARWGSKSLFIFFFDINYLIDSLVQHTTCAGNHLPPRKFQWNRLRCIPILPTSVYPPPYLRIVTVGTLPVDKVRKSSPSVVTATLSRAAVAARSGGRRSSAGRSAGVRRCGRGGRSRGRTASSSATAASRSRGCGSGTGAGAVEAFGPAATPSGRGNARGS